MTEEKISELNNRLIEITQSEHKRKLILKN